MEAACLDFLKLPTLTFVEAIDIRRDFAWRKADGDLILCLLQDQLQHFHLDSFSSSTSSSKQRSASSFSNSRPSKRRMRKHRQFQKSEVSNWKKEAVHSSQEFRNHLKTETFFQRRNLTFRCPRLNCRPLNWTLLKRTWIQLPHLVKIWTRLLSLARTLNQKRKVLRSLIVRV
jgi:hypothetical protein